MHKKRISFKYGRRRIPEVVGLLIYLFIYLLVGWGFELMV
jgi:hypothetical protein